LTKDKALAVKCAVSGALAGALNGFFGGGGGMLLVPLLTKWAKLEEKKAFATCVLIILPLCAVSAAVYLFQGAAYVTAALPYLIGGAIGGTAAGKLFPKIPVKLLRRAMALLIIFGGARSLFS
jgi:uncharacterized membrane protein YfcA